MEIQITQPHKSIQSTTFSLPDLCILTGKNGSGKSHLMEAMTNSEKVIIIQENGIRLSNIKYVPFNGLNPSGHYQKLSYPIYKRELKML